MAFLAILSLFIIVYGGLEMLIGGTALLLFTYTIADSMVWISVVIIGLGSASVFATTLSVIQNVVRVSGKISALLHGAFSIGMMVFPP